MTIPASKVTAFIHVADTTDVKKDSGDRELSEREKNDGTD